MQKIILFRFCFVDIYVSENIPSKFIDNKTIRTNLFDFKTNFLNLLSKSHLQTPHEGHFLFLCQLFLILCKHSSFTHCFEFVNSFLMKEMRDMIQKIGRETKEISLDFDSQRSEDLLIKDALFVRHDGSLVKLKHIDILWLKGDGNYTTIVARNSVFSVRNLLKDFEDVLPSDQYIRIHKSYIARIDEINTINTREIKVGKDLVPVGRTYYHNLVDRIQKLSPSGD